MHSTLQLILILLAAAVLVVTLFRTLALPSILGYLLVGILIGPSVFALIPDTSATRYLAEFGVVFLMFSIGLEFSLPQFYAMRRIVLGLGGAQVIVTVLITLITAALWGMHWTGGLILGGVLAMSSTAIASKMLAERGEIQAPHGRQVMGVLLFQDLAVIPFLILVPALAGGTEAMAWTLGLAAIKAVVVLTILLFVGQRLMRPWFNLVAKRKSPELFMINLLLVTLGLAYLTELAGLSLVLGAFLAGMLISETEYRHQVEADIKPFRDVLLGLFFITIGMMLDLKVVAQHWVWVLLLVAAIILVKTLVVVGLSRLFRNEASVALRTGLYLAQAGEFGFVLLALASNHNLLNTSLIQISFAAILLSMLAAPFIIQFNSRLVAIFCRSDWNMRARELLEISVHSGDTADGHVIICGYGRSGQNLARFFESEGFAFIALDFDPARVRQAAAAGESVVYGDAGRREVLAAAGIYRARALVISYADTSAALKVLYQARELRPDLPVVVRTLDDTDLERLKAAGAAEVVPEILEGSLMLASHVLMLLGVPLARVVKQIRRVREQRYSLMRGFYRGLTDAEVDLTEAAQSRLASIRLPDNASAVGKTLGELDLSSLNVAMTAIRRRNIRGLDPVPETKLRAGDVVVLQGAAEDLAQAEAKLLRG